MPNFMQEYHWNDLNAPALSGQVGAMNAVAREVLVEGYGKDSIPVTSITRSGTTATVTLAAADIMRLQAANCYVTISGATGGDASLYNGTFLVATIPSTTTFTYTMAGTPTGSATGTLLMSTKLPITSITRSGTTATATLANNNLTLTSNTWLTIGGATGGDATYYNGTFQITPTSPTTFTYTMTGTPSGSATGTLTYYKAGAQWTKEFENSAGTITAFRNAVVSGYGRHYLRLDDSGVSTGGAKECTICGFETMIGESQGTGQWPQQNMLAAVGTMLYPGPCWRKSTTLDTTLREWHFCADSRFMCGKGSPENPPGTGVGSTSTGMGIWLWAFGECNPIKTGDTDCCLVQGSVTYNTANTGTGATSVGMSAASCTMNGNYLTFPSGGAYFARGSGGVGACYAHVAAPGMPYTPSSSNYGLGSTSLGGFAFPCPLDGGMWLTPLVGMEWNGTYWVPRCMYPGLFTHMHGVWPANNLDKISNAQGLPAGAIVQAWGLNHNTSTGYGGLYFVDVTGNAWT